MGPQAIPIIHPRSNGINEGRKINGNERDHDFWSDEK